jgi:adenylate kinase family enzyme
MNPIPPGKPDVNLPLPGPRIAVVGVTGAGKTTTAARLARAMDLPHIELDALHWQPGWVMIEREPFRHLVTQALSRPAWITDGNYRKARDLIWARATTLVWLDYSLPVILWQLTQRTLKRIFTREELWNGNRETLRGAFFSKDSLFLWAVQSYPKQRLEYRRDLASPEYAHLQMVRLRSRKQTDAWLAQIEKWAGQHKY